MSWTPILKGLLTPRDPKTLLVLTASRLSRQAAEAFLDRLKERTTNRDRSVGTGAFLRQLIAIHAWGRQAPQEVGHLGRPILVMDGDRDIMVPSVNSANMARRRPGAGLARHEDAVHGGIFQNDEAFTRRAVAPLDA